MKTLYVMRGASGAGKSTLAKQIASQPDSIICSADDFMTVNGKYEWDGTNLYYAHSRCNELVLNSMIHGVKNIILDNCNVVFKEFRSHVKSAYENGYAICLVEAPNNHLSAEELFELNVHNVPLSTIEKFKKKFASERDVLIYTKRLCPDIKIVPYAKEILQSVSGEQVNLCGT